jgi:hypothetical protein
MYTVTISLDGVAQRTVTLLIPCSTHPILCRQLFPKPGSIADGLAILTPGGIRRLSPVGIRQSSAVAHVRLVDRTEIDRIGFRAETSSPQYQVFEKESA